MRNPIPREPSRPPPACRRRTLIAALPLCCLGVSAAWAQQAEAPRLKFRSRRAVCECSGDTDDEAIERAAEKLRSKEPAGKADGKPASSDKTEATRSSSVTPAPDGASRAPEGKPDSDRPTTRRQTP